MSEKLKSFLADDALFYVLLVVLVAVASFGLGKRSFELENSLKATNSGQAAMTQLSSLELQVKTQNDAKITVVASKSGTKYHLPDCPGAGQMKSENKIEFASIEAAKAAGYEPAANCPGLQ